MAAAAWPDADPPSAASLSALPPVLARRVLRQWLGSPPPSLAEVERVLLVATGAVRSTELAGGRTVRRASGKLFTTR